MLNCGFQPTFILADLNSAYQSMLKLYLYSTSSFHAQAMWDRRSFTMLLWVATSSKTSSHSRSVTISPLKGMHPHMTYTLGCGHALMLLCKLRNTHVAHLYQQLEAAGITYISIGHRRTLYNYHKKVLHISNVDPLGIQENWRLESINKDDVYKFSMR